MSHHGCGEGIHHQVHPIRDSRNEGSITQMHDKLAPRSFSTCTMCCILRKTQVKNLAGRAREWMKMASCAACTASRLLPLVTRFKPGYSRRVDSLFDSVLHGGGYCLQLDHSFIPPSNREQIIFLSKRGRHTSSDVTSTKLQL